MDDLRYIIARNIVDLRKHHSITQAELAERLNYSDKAISKWERGESLPDIVVLKQVADLFEVEVDYLLTEDHTEYQTQKKLISKRRRINHIMITLIAIVLVIGVALFAFINMSLIADIHRKWIVFVAAIPVICIVWLVFNSIWFDKKVNYLIISGLMWSTLATIFFIAMGYLQMAWLIFLLGIPGQVIIILWSRIKPIRHKVSVTSKKG